MLHQRAPRKRSTSAAHCTTVRPEPEEESVVPVASAQRVHHSANQEPGPEPVSAPNCTSGKVECCLRVSVELGRKSTLCYISVRPGPDTESAPLCIRVHPGCDGAPRYTPLADGVLGDGARLVAGGPGPTVPAPRSRNRDAAHLLTETRPSENVAGTWNFCFLHVVQVLVNGLANSDTPARGSQVSCSNHRRARVRVDT